MGLDKRSDDCDEDVEKAEVDGRDDRHGSDIGIGRMGVDKKDCIVWRDERDGSLRSDARIEVMRLIGIL